MQLNTVAQHNYNLAIPGFDQLQVDSARLSILGRTESFPFPRVSNQVASSGQESQATIHLRQIEPLRSQPEAAAPSSKLASGWQTSLTAEHLISQLNQPQFSTAQETAWAQLQPAFRYEESRYVATSEGINTWQDLGALINQGLVQCHAGSSQFGRQLSFQLDDYLLVDQSQPSQRWIEHIQHLVRELAPDKQVQIIVRGDPLDPPAITRIGADTIEANAEPKPLSLSLTQTMLQTLRQTNPILAKVYQALDASLAKALETHARPPLHDVLAGAIPLLNQQINQQLKPDEQALKIESHQQTKITKLHQQLAQTLNTIGLNSRASTTVLDTMLAQTERTSIGAYSVGGGQTLSLLSLVLGAMDRGELPLDTRVEGDNRSNRSDQSSAGKRSNPAVAEIVEQSQRKANLGKNLFFTKPHQPHIHMRPEEQRIQRLQEHPPQWLFMNVPTNALKGVLNQDFLQTLAQMPKAPAIILSAKSFSASEKGVDVPATEIFSQLYNAKPGLQKNLLVLGGYFAAPWVVTDQPVHFVVAGKNAAVVDSLASIMPKDSDVIKFDKCSGKSDQLFGTAIMGALKNQAVYSFARQLVQQGFELMTQNPLQTVEQHCQSLNEWAQPFADTTIAEAERAVEILTEDDDVPLDKRHSTGALGFRAVDNFQCAQGVRVDFERCMVHPITPVFVNFIKELYQICTTSQPPQALTALLEEKVQDAGQGFGSRNSRDGVIDQAIAILHTHRPQEGLFEQSSFEQVRHQWTPQTWLTKTTEGRNGIMPILKHLTQFNRPVPPMIEKAAQYYAQANNDLAEILEGSAKSLK